MKYCKAWPDACLAKVKSDFDLGTLVDRSKSDDGSKTLDFANATTDAPVWPKGLVNQTVESIANQSVEALLKASFEDSLSGAKSSGAKSAGKQKFEAIKAGKRSKASRRSASSGVSGRSGRSAAESSSELSFERHRRRKMSARSRWADDPVDVPAMPKGPSAGVQTDRNDASEFTTKASISARRERPYYHEDDTKAVWAAFAILAILFIVVVGSLMQRVRTLEASVHGRLMA
jgi:hypothetical protein